MNKRFETIDAYMESFPEDVREKLQAIRATIRETAPEAEEVISYQLPTFRLAGNLVHFGAWKQHIGFYPASSGVAHFEEELAGYEQSKGAIRFPLDRPIPLDLIARIVEFRVRENLERAARKKRTKG